MGFKISSSLLCLALFLACSSAIHAFDITKILGQNPEFSTFNKYLTETKLAEQINSMKTVTVLAVTDSAIGSIAQESSEAIKAIIGNQVLVGYFDGKKLVEAQAYQTQIPTLYPKGFVKVFMVGEGGIAFNSAANPNINDAVEFMSTIYKEQDTISVLKVVKLMVTPGIDSQQVQDAKTPDAATKDSRTPDNKTVPDDKTPDDISWTQAAKSPVPAQSPVAMAPDAAAAPTSSASTTKMGLVGAVMAFASLFVVL